jgi:hypothetical protein
LTAGIRGRENDYTFIISWYSPTLNYAHIEFAPERWVVAEEALFVKSVDRMNPEFRSMEAPVE